MKAALLCNGPSKVAFKSSLGYNYVIGCNIPWTNVDATVILDREIVKCLGDRPELIDYKIYFGRDAWRFCDEIKKRKYFLDYFHKIVDPKPPYYSSGHMALQVLVDEGYTEIDIYGCDSRFTTTLESYTHQYANSSSDNIMMCISSWNVRWDKMIESNPNVKVNFIKE